MFIFFHVYWNEYTIDSFEKKTFCVKETKNIRNKKCLVIKTFFKFLKNVHEHALEHLGICPHKLNFTLSIPRKNNLRKRGGGNFSKLSRGCHRRKNRAKVFISSTQTRSVFFKKITQTKKEKIEVFSSKTIWKEEKSWYFFFLFSSFFLFFNYNLKNHDYLNSFKYFVQFNQYMVTSIPFYDQ